MTMMTTIIAVALGFAPVQGDRSVVQISNAHDSMTGSFTQTVDDTGTTHLRGVNRMTGEIFHLTVNPHGRVRGSVGESTITFQIQRTS